MLRIRSLAPVNCTPHAASLLLVALAATTLAAQPPVDLTRLNREGRWTEVVAIVPRLLADSMMTPGARCETRASFAVALGRLHRDEDATSQADAFDRECAALPAGHWTRREVAGVRASAATAPPRVAPLPATGIDFSAVDAFWQAVDTLSRDVPMSDAQGDARRTTAGNRLLPRFYVTSMRETLDATFRPSRKAYRDSVLAAPPSNLAIAIRHLTRVASLRPMLTAYRDTLSLDRLIPGAIEAAGAYLPPGATALGAPPLVGFAVFAPDGFAADSGIVADLSIALESNLRLFLAHEFHHVYLTRIGAPVSGRGPGGELRIAVMLGNLRNEGIADLVDKPYPLTREQMAIEWYVTRYNQEYDRTPQALRTLDSLLATAGRDSTQRDSVAKRIPEVLVFGGHPAGARMARTILETLGKAPLMRAVTNPATFLRLYAEAETRSGRPDPWSPATRAFIDTLETRYFRGTR